MVTLCRVIPSIVSEEEGPGSITPGGLIAPSIPSGREEELHNTQKDTRWLDLSLSSFERERERERALAWPSHVQPP